MIALLIIVLALTVTNVLTSRDLRRAQANTQAAIDIAKQWEGVAKTWEDTSNKWQDTAEILTGMLNKQ